MGDGILSAIIAVEQEIQERLADEERRAAQMLDQLRRELEQETARERERLAASAQQALARGEAEARARAGALVGRAANRAEQLDALEDQTLERCILKHLGRIAGEQER